MQAICSLLAKCSTTTRAARKKRPWATSLSSIGIVRSTGDTGTETETGGKKGQRSLAKCTGTGLECRSTGQGSGVRWMMADGWLMGTRPNDRQGFLLLRTRSHRGPFAIKSGASGTGVGFLIWTWLHLGLGPTSVECSQLEYFLRIYRDSTKNADSKTVFSEITNVTIQQKTKIECQDGASLSSCPEREGGKEAWEVPIRDTQPDKCSRLPSSLCVPRG